MTHSIYYALIYRELRSAISGAAFYWKVAIAMIAFQLFLLIVYGFASSDATQISMRLSDMAASLHILILVGVWVIVPVVTATSVQEDLEEGTLESLRATPLAPFWILLSKSVAISLQVVAVGFVFLPVLAAVYSYLGQPWSFLVESFVLLGFCSMCATCLGLFVSCAVRQLFIVPFALYTLLTTVLLMPVAYIALRIWWDGAAPSTGQDDISPVWAILHPWQIRGGQLSAYAYLAYLFMTGILFQVGAHRVLRRPQYHEARDMPRSMPPKWTPIPDRVNPISAIYIKINSFNTRPMQWSLFAAGVAGGLFFRVRLINDWQFAPMAHMWNVDFLLFTIILVSVLVASQESAALRVNRDQLRMSLLSAKSVDAGCAWGAVKLCRTLLAGVILGRFLTYFAGAQLWPSNLVEPSLSAFLIESLTYVPIGAYFVLSSAQSGQVSARTHTGFAVKVLMGTMMVSYILELVSGNLPALGFSDAMSELIRLGVYSLYAFFLWFTTFFIRNHDAPWKPATGWFGNAADE